MNIYYLKKFRREAKEKIKARYRKLDENDVRPFEVYCYYSSGTYVYQPSDAFFRSWSKTEEDIVENLRLARIHYVLDLVKQKRSDDEDKEINSRLEKL